MTPTNLDTDRARILANDEVTVPVVREELDVTKRTVVTGEVELRKRSTLEDVTLELERTDLRYDIARRAVGSVHETMPAATTQEGESTVYRVIEEVPVVTTHYRIVEEIVVTPTREVTAQPTVIPTRRESVDIIRRPQPVNDPLA